MMMSSEIAVVFDKLKSSAYARDIGFTTIANVLVVLLTGLSGVMAARLLGVENRGVLAILVLWPAFIASVGSLGLPEGIVYFMASRPHKAQSIYISALVLWTIQALAFSGVAYSIVHHVLIRNHVHGEILPLIAAVSVGISLLTVYQAAMLQGKGQMHLYNWVRIGPVLAYAIGLASLYLLSVQSILAVAVVLLISQVVGCVTGTVSTYGLVSNVRMEQILGLGRQLLVYSAKSHVSGVISLGNAWAGQLLTSLFMPVAQLGLYAVAVSVSSLSLPLAQAIAVNVFPRLGRVSIEYPDQRVSMINGTLLTAGVASGLIAIGLVFTGPFLLYLLFGKDFVAAQAVLSILAMASIPLSLNLVSAHILRGLNRPLIPAFGEIGGLVVNVTLLAWLLPAWGIVGAAIASACAFAATSVFRLPFLRPYLSGPLLRRSSS